MTTIITRLKLAEYQRETNGFLSVFLLLTDSSVVIILIKTWEVLAYMQRAPEKSMLSWIIYWPFIFQFKWKHVLHIGRFSLLFTSLHQPCVFQQHRFSCSSRFCNFEQASFRNPTSLYISCIQTGTKLSKHMNAHWTVTNHGRSRTLDLIFIFFSVGIDAHGGHGDAWLGH